MTAKQLLYYAGQNLLGKKVFTDEMGEYPGGVATVIEINPDPGSDIAFMVQHPAWKSDICQDGTIGILDFEEVDGPDEEGEGEGEETKPQKFLVEFHRTTCEKAFFEVGASGTLTADNLAKAFSSDDPRLEFEPMSSTMEIHSVKPTE